MARWLRSLRSFLGLTFPNRNPVRAISRSIDTDFSVFREGDRAIVYGKSPLLTKPLAKGRKTDVRRGVLEHDQIIGRRARDLIQAHKGPVYRVNHPTLDEYVALTPRLVTPIYSADANLIVSLLDIHVSPPPAEGEGGEYGRLQKQQPLEILESGTGHGSLTLHLARAIQAANTHPPSIPSKSQICYLQDRPTRPGAEEEEKIEKDIRKESDGMDSNGDADVDTVQQQWDTWRAQRNAVIHSVDVSPKFSAHAEKVVRGFRRGIYAGDVDFYVGHVENWIAEQTKIRTSSSSSLLFSPLRKQYPDTAVEPFLSYAILDMPSAQFRIPHVSPILRRDGMLVVFMPSVTQIGDCVDLIRRRRLPLVMDKVVELGSGISGGRLWDVRFAVKKSRADPSSWAEQQRQQTSSSPSGLEDDDATASSSSSSGDDEGSGEGDPENISASQDAQKEDESVLVCRPKVGTRIVGGGFVGLWRKIEEEGL